MRKSLAKPKKQKDEESDSFRSDSSFRGGTGSQYTTPQDQSKEDIDEN